MFMKVLNAICLGFWILTLIKGIYFLIEGIEVHPLLFIIACVVCIAYFFLSTFGEWVRK